MIKEERDSQGKITAITDDQGREILRVHPDGTWHPGPRVKELKVVVESDTGGPDIEIRLI